MKTIKTQFNVKCLFAGLLTCLLGNAVCATALVFDETNMSTIGNVNNAANANGYGSVSYEYQIGTYEVTNYQYAAFLNAVAKTDTHSLYNVNMGGSFGGITRSGTEGSYTYTAKAGFENRPVNYVSNADAFRFVNWLTNGQGSGSTETGSYDMSLNLKSILRMTLGTASSLQYYVASEDEWFKAAYYDPTLNDGAGGYWQYGTSSNVSPTPSAATSDPNSANISRAPVPSGPRPINVGSYVGSSSYYGLFDTDGNVSEFMDTLTGTGWVRRGSWYDTTSANQIGSGYRGIAGETDEGPRLGFRITIVQVPEPAAASLLGVVVAVAGILGYRKRLSRIAKKERV